ncbi:uncharacterized protein KY384_008945 [Bacidia gigantensis]|uniref:uncharacterized protein n=1 Tax=Bacidia gigantensis TaxID=2732470 RepID=UPI001D051A10|nr:uncharacterized protein KY384_008945 [Bacidia gigantensis]KAG8525301.1 hypothetical protein KY384_008945 [Bacidia gigantensis]
MPHVMTPVNNVSRVARPGGQDRAQSESLFLTPWSGHSAGLPLLGDVMNHHSHKDVSLDTPCPKSSLDKAMIPSSGHHGKAIDVIEAIVPVVLLTIAVADPSHKVTVDKPAVPKPNPTTLDTSPRLIGEASMQFTQRQKADGWQSSTNESLASSDKSRVIILGQASSDADNFQRAVQNISDTSDLTRRALPLNTPRHPSQNSGPSFVLHNGHEKDRAQKPGDREAEGKCTCTNLPPCFRKNIARPETFAGTEANFFKHVMQIATCQGHSEKLRQAARGILLERRLGGKQEANARFGGSQHAATDNREGAAVDSSLTTNMTEQNRFTNKNTENISLSKITATAHVPHEKRSNQQKKSNGNEQSTTVVIDLTTPKKASNTFAAALATPSPSARRVRHQTEPPQLSKKPSKPTKKVDRPQEVRSGSSRNENAAHQSPGTAVKGVLTDFKNSFQKLETLMQGVNFNPGAEATQTSQINHSTLNQAFVQENNQGPVIQPLNNANDRGDPVTRAAAPTLPTQTAPAAQQPQDRPVADGVVHPQRQRKRKTAAERKVQYPPLDPALPATGAASDADLITYGKIKNAYQRHVAAPYAYYWGGRLHASFKYLLGRAGTNGLPSWTPEEIYRIR